MHEKERIKKEFGLNLKQLREQRLKSNGKKWTQKDLAYEAGIMEPNHISKLERGEAEPGLFTLLALAYALDCTMDALIKKDAWVKIMRL